MTRKKKIIIGVAVTIAAFVLLCCIAALLTPKKEGTVDVTVTAVSTQPPVNTSTSTIEPTATQIVATDTAIPTLTSEPTLTSTVMPTIVQRIAPRPSATAYIPSNTIVCQDGFVWPSPVRKGACHGHGGIR